MSRVRSLVLVGQVRVVEQVTLEEKFCGLMHRPFKLYPIGTGAQSSEADDDITLLVVEMLTNAVHRMCLVCFTRYRMLSVGHTLGADV